MNAFRLIAKLMAEKAHNNLIIATDGEALNGDDTEEFSVMLREELDKINGNK